jgi:DNA invertase Pin-like site-specific DNA recombinase
VRASIYCRISRDREGAGLGVATQEADCRELARKLGWTVVTVHTDNDMSAHSGRSRPGYENLLKQIGSGDIGAVLAWHTDRLHRSPVELEAYVVACETHGVITQTVKAGHIDLTTASGLMIARMLGATARYEVDHQIERQRRAKKRSAEAGKWKGGRRPYGYAADGVTLVPDEAKGIADATTALLEHQGEVIGIRRPDVASLVARDRGDEVQALESQAVALRSRLDSMAGFYAQGMIDAQQLTEGTKAINVALAEVRDKISKIYDGSALAGIVDTDDAGSAWLEAPLDRKRAVLDALATVTLLRGGLGRPAGWQPGQTYFRPELVKIEWKQS